MSKAEKLNPQVRTVEIGVRKLRPIKIYPLSFHDQEEIIETLMEGLNEFSTTVNAEERVDSEIPKLIFDTIHNHLSKIIVYVVDEKEEIDIKHITNMQISEIIRCIYEVNFEEPAKNVQNLLSLLKPMMNQVQQG